MNLSFPVSLRWLLPAVALASVGLAGADAGMLELSAGLHRIEAEVAATHSERMKGLMYRARMADGHGMLFVFDQDAGHCMWMKNTNIPLSVAFMDPTGRILNIADMTPHSEQSHCAAGKARFALEMNKGWFAKRRVVAGTKISGIEKAPASE